MFFLIGANVPVLFFERTMTIIKETFAGGSDSLFLIPVLWVVFACTIPVVDSLRKHDPDIQDLPREIPMRTVSDTGNADTSIESRDRALSESSSASANTARRRGSVDDSSFIA
ncbi:unnamed protein product [Prorocentrum cordatum]|uniref:Uncharacterized protein n=1 Tax=Prorocentrum cordatum TaxID=2364126 RepID=A0ABN9XD24_9DINO|nr:unnamed protein product [Polarella glacialis]